MKLAHLHLYQAALLALAVTSPACAQGNAAVTARSVAQTPAVAKNPTFLFRTLSVSQEWDRLADGGHTLKTSLGYTEPFRHASLSLGVSVPFSTPTPAEGPGVVLPNGTSLQSDRVQPDLSSSVGGPSSADQSIALGDVVLKSQWIPYLATNHGVLVTTSLTMPTSRDARVGNGRWTITPSIAYARFWGPRLLIAQFFQQQTSFAGSAQRAQVNRSDLDLYMVFSGRSLQWWINSDINLGIDEANHNKTPASATISYGRGLRRMFGGSLNGSIQAGAGIGSDRPYNAMVSGGISLVGFHRRR